MAEQPLVSVVVPCHGHAPYLRDAVASLQDQTLAEWECIAVTDGSPDAVADVAAGIAHDDDRVVVLDTPNGGVSVARNLAVRRSTGRYVLPLDGDDRLSQRYLEACVAELERHPDVTVVYGAAAKFGAASGPWPLAPYRFDRLLRFNMIHVAGMFRRADFDRVGGYDEAMRDGLEDWEFWIRLLEPDQRAVRLDTVTLYRRMSIDTRTTRLEDSGRVPAVQRYVYCKHAALYERFFADPISLYEDYERLRSKDEFCRRRPVRGSALHLREWWRARVGRTAELEGLDP